MKVSLIIMAITLAMFSCTFNRGLSPGSLDDAEPSRNSTQVSKCLFKGKAYDTTSGRHIPFHLIELLNDTLVIAATVTNIDKGEYEIWLESDQSEKVSDIKASGVGYKAVTYSIAQQRNDSLIVTDFLIPSGTKSQDIIIYKHPNKGLGSYD